MVVGGGGREHALAWKLAKEFDLVYCAPGNAGTSRIGNCKNVRIPATDIQGLVDFAEKERIDLTIVGPEAPLSMGIADEFKKKGLKIFGPTKNAARLESSKAFAKEHCRLYGIPTPDYAIYHHFKDALDHYSKHGGKIVTKADGLAGGKGVEFPNDYRQIVNSLRGMMLRSKYGDAGNVVIIEKRCSGEELSEIGLSDGFDYMGLATSQDHKRLCDGDGGPNTGGMGAYSPAPAAKGHEKQIKEMMVTAIRGMEEIDIPYHGALYGGIMITPEGLKVLEFNSRFGDPETQPVIYRMKSGLADYLFAAAEGSLKRKRPIKWDPRPAVCVVLSSFGYPEEPWKGKMITGLYDVEKMDDVFAFHAGTSLGDDGNIYTNGGRVLGVTALGRYENDFQGAIDRAYDAVDRINFVGKHFRKDIGQRALNRQLD